MKKSNSFDVLHPFYRFYRHEKFFELLDKFKIKQWQWLFLSVFVAGADFVSGANIQFPILYMLPIALASWSGKRIQALILAVVLPCLRLIFRVMWNLPWMTIDSTINILIRITIFIILAYLVSTAKELHVLRGFLHVCGYCGRIMNDDGNWISMQNYITIHSEAVLSHGICPDCIPKFKDNLVTLEYSKE
jgi:hypothetical protein